MSVFEILEAILKKISVLELAMFYVAYMTYKNKKNNPHQLKKGYFCNLKCFN